MATQMTYRPTLKEGSYCFNHSRGLRWRHHLGHRFPMALDTQGEAETNWSVNWLRQSQIASCVFFIWVCSHHKFGESPKRMTAANLSVYLCLWNPQEAYGCLPFPTQLGANETKIRTVNKVSVITSSLTRTYQKRKKWHYGDMTFYRFRTAICTKAKAGVRWKRFCFPKERLSC